MNFTINGNTMTVFALILTNRGHAHSPILMVVVSWHLAYSIHIGVSIFNSLLLFLCFGSTDEHVSLLPYAIVEYSIFHISYNKTCTFFIRVNQINAHSSWLFALDPISFHRVWHSLIRQSTQICALSYTVTVRHCSNWALKYMLFWVRPQRGQHVFEIRGSARRKSTVE